MLLQLANGQAGLMCTLVRCTPCAFHDLILTHCFVSAELLGQKDQDCTHLAVVGSDQKHRLSLKFTVVV